MPETPAVVVANAPLQWTEALVDIVRSAPLCLAADGGANHLARIGLRPRAVVGDLDSISQGTRSWVGEDRMVRRDDQDRTDLDKTLDYAFGELGLERIRVLAAVGGRVDHAVGNLGLLARHAKGENLVLLEEDLWVLALRGAHSLGSQPGEIWSFWTFDPEVRVSLAGVEWPVEEQALDVGGQPSISNRAIADRVSVRATGGAVIVMREL